MSAEHYREQTTKKQKELSEARNRINDLESDVADRDYKINQLEAATGRQASVAELRAAHARIKELEETTARAAGDPEDDARLKMEVDGSDEHQQMDTMSKRLKDLEKENGEYYTWLTGFEASVGMKANDVVEKLTSLDVKLRDADAIESALRTQVRNLEKKLTKADEKAEKADRKLGETQNEVQKLKAKLFRASLPKYVLLLVVHEHGMLTSYSDGTLAPASSPQTPMPKRKASDLHAPGSSRDGDDDEDTIKATPKKVLTPRTPLTSRLRSSLQENSSGKSR